MRRFVAVALCGLTGLLTVAGPVHAAGGPNSSQPKSSTSTPTNWNQRDTAVYVVSTMNLLRTHKGESVVNLLKTRLNVSRFDVLDDLASQSLYFIQLKNDSGAVVGALAYQMGWQKPRGLSPSLGHMGIYRAPDAVQRAYGADQKALMYSFTTTLPS